MPTLPPLPEPIRPPRRHVEAKKPGINDADSQSTLSDAKIVGTSTTLVVPEPPSEVTAITQSPCVGAACALVWHTLSEKAKERERIEARGRVDAKLAEKAKELAAASWSKELAAAADRSKEQPTTAARSKELEAAAAIMWVDERVATKQASASAKAKARKAAQAKAQAMKARHRARLLLAAEVAPTVTAAVAPDVVCSPSTVPSPTPGTAKATTDNDLASTATRPNNFIGRKVAFDPALWAHVETLLLRLRKRKKYVDSTCLHEECLQHGRISGTIKWRSHHQQSNSYNIAFEFKSFKIFMLPANEVDPYMVAILPYVAATHEENEESNRVTRMINRVPESEHGLCPASDDEDGDDLNLTEAHDCFRTISDDDTLDDAAWIRRKQVNFAFMDQDSYDDLPTLMDNDDLHKK
jgi:hypothetical protein